MTADEHTALLALIERHNKRDIGLLTFATECFALGCRYFKHAPTQPVPHEEQMAWLYGTLGKRFEHISSGATVTLDKIYLNDNGIIMVNGLGTGNYLSLTTLLDTRYWKQVG